MKQFVLALLILTSSFLTATAHADAVNDIIIKGAELLRQCWCDGHDTKSLTAQAQTNMHELVPGETGLHLEADPKTLSHDELLYQLMYLKYAISEAQADSDLKAMQSAQTQFDSLMEVFRLRFTTTLVEPGPDSVSR